MITHPGPVNLMPEPKDEKFEMQKAFLNVVCTLILLALGIIIGAKTIEAGFGIKIQSWWMYSLGTVLQSIVAIIGSALVKK